ncbi:CaiB/BaiF CoA transferase family protein [Pseudoteredinibacter isoporae]|uniref:Crotonobetainyl-CoA:carnitine CoA-transferase CaiB-like acyl-CoA transferase n=1 Tax=Pseudoteredinibacter isoporae TaxID=570281 RepID=A0A7X0MWB9_9GAMM|nr:CaiB/BaiF CoA-transferase family protein [Pseudoteredinibacter isoporae]MBB6520774.1 crotonobetainyl-CoA:carnitine CoA-transferase CaiB-like acyl-CoA transferase [Pseudoteredinibacter isoporae]NHO86340.1 CoA transferase [Pseudoteredinibacter isoporae]NIB25208.1 CoA transferase [Pseudoteredinibacter isoporae]
MSSQASDSQKTGPLTGFRVLDMSRILAGPWSAQTLADLGAQVIKVERPKVGDDTRRWGPPYLKDKDGQDTAEAAYYTAANRGKDSITVDITQAEGQNIIKQLAQKCDVLIENYKVGGLKKYGLDYEALKEINPALIYCSITGFGQDGPYAQRAGYDFMIQGMGGLMSITGEKDGEPGAGPQKVGVAVTDLFTGLYATIAIQGALLERERSGLGQHIDLALLDVQTAVLANQASNYLVGGTVPQRMGNAHPNIVPYQAFATSNGFIILAVGNDGQFAKLLQLAGREELMQDERFATNPARVQNRDVVCQEVAEIMVQQSSEYWLEELSVRGVPCGPINNIEQVFANPQIQHRQMQIDVEHPLSGSISLCNSPIKYSRTAIEISKAPPLLGSDTDDVLSDLLGMDETQLNSLREKGCI